MRTAFVLAAVAGLAATAGVVHADSLGRPCTDRPESEYLNLDALKAKVVEQGYQIRSGEISKACGEFYVLNKDGKRGELFVDPTKIVAGDGKGDAAMSGESANGATKIAAGDADDRRDGGQRDGDD